MCNTSKIKRSDSYASLWKRQIIWKHRFLYAIEKNILKLYCKLVFNDITALITQNNIILLNQCGFMAILSTAHQIIDFLFEIKMSFQHKNFLCINIMFLDKKEPWGIMRKK